MQKRKWSRFAVLILVIAQLTALAAPMVFASDADGVGSATVTGATKEFSLWRINGGGTITTPVYTINRTYSAPVLSMTAVPPPAPLAAGESASVALSASYDSPHTDTVTSDRFTISFSARARADFPSAKDTTINSVRYDFTKDGVTYSKTISIGQKLPGSAAGPGDEKTISRELSITELGLTRGTYSVSLYIDSSRDDYMHPFGSITIAGPAIAEINKPAFSSYNYSIFPAAGYNVSVDGSTAMVTRTANADSSDTFSASVSGVNQTDGALYTANATFPLAGVRTNSHTFTADAKKAAPIPGNLASQSVRTGSSVTVPSVTAKLGWEFTGWEPAITDGTLTADGADHAYVAQFAQMDDSNVMEIGNATATPGENVDVAVSVRNTDDLAGLRTTIAYDADELELQHVSMPDSLDAYAVNDTVPGQVIFNAISDPGITTPSMEIARLTFKSAPGFSGTSDITLESVEARSSNFEPIDFIKNNGSITVETLLYNITIDQTENGTVEADKTTAAEGETVTLTVTPDEGYRLVSDSLKVNGEAIEGNTFAMPASDVTVSAQFELIPPTLYNITIDQTENGTVEADKTTAAEGETVTLTVTPDEGYQLVSGSLKVNGEAVEGNAFTMPASDVTVSAQFELIPPTLYNITIDQTENGTVEADKTTAAEGETVTLTVTPDEGYQLVSGSVKVNGEAVEGNTFTMPASDVTVSAQFELIPPTLYNIIIDQTENGTVEADKTTAAEGETVTLTVTPDEGYQLVSGSLKVNGEAIEGNTFEMPASDVTVSAQFELIPPTLYNITIDQTENGIVEADKTTAAEGETVTLTVSPADGYRLVSGSLKVNGEAIEGNAFTMPASDVTVTARFERVIVEPTLPSVTDVTFTGETVVGQTLTAQYTYVSDKPESGTTFKWLTAPHGSTLYTPISGATGSTFTVTAACAGMDIVVEVTPGNADGQGTPVIGGNGRNQAALLGDLNHDGTVDFVDAMILIQAINGDGGIEAMDAKTRIIADANHDGAVDILDTILILRSDVGLINLN